MSLDELLKELEIEDDGEKEIDLKDVKLEDIPEEQRPIFEKAISLLEGQTNKIAEQGLQINTLKEAFDKVPKPEAKKEEEKPKGFMGLEEDDPYLPVFKSFAQKINSIGVKSPQQLEAEFETNIQAFAAENKDIVQYVKEMDGLVKDHPTLKQDVPKLYQLAKAMKGGEEKSKQSSETTGNTSRDVVQTVQSKSLSEAFDSAQKTLK